MRSALAGHKTASVVDRVDAADGSQQRIQAARIRNLDHKAQGRNTLAVGRGGGGKDIAACIANGNGDVLEQAHAVQALDHDLDLEESVGSTIPLYVNHALGVLHEALDVGAVGAMHRDTSATRDEADDIVARHRIAAMR